MSTSTPAPGCRPGPATKMVTRTASILAELAATTETGAPCWLRGVSEHLDAVVTGRQVEAARLAAIQEEYLRVR